MAAAGGLRAALERQTVLALERSALLPIETALTHIENGGVRFGVRVAANLVRKDAALRTLDAPPRDPFLPYEADLFVADLSPTHVALLNKFNVIDRHLLIVTRRFEPQEALLDVADFAALVAALREIDGLGFYNGGTVAGASQPHKHLQMVPLPLDESGPPVPMEALLDRVPAMSGKWTIAVVPGLKFRHAFAHIDLLADNADEAARAAQTCYRALLDAAGVNAINVGGVAHQGAPYNLLVTRRWMLLVPRSRERIDGISVNTLGFAGSFFVRDTTQLHTLAQIGPMKALEHVSFTSSI
jgi:sulfate adenylyltransferase (ADP) / ATP adenylyltransferase